MSKKICTLFLLLALSVQILPVQQMGNALFSNQFTEELPHSPEADKDFSKKEPGKPDYLSTPLFAIDLNCINTAFRHHHMKDDIPQNHTGDIHVPPPNC